MAVPNYINTRHHTPDESRTYFITRQTAPHRKGQLKFFETIAVLIVFLILLGLAMIFYNYIQEQSFVRDQDKHADSTAVTIIEKALLLPELDCSVTGVVSTNCIDLLKAVSFARLTGTDLTTKADYFTRFQTSTLVLKHVWPRSEQDIVFYNSTPSSYKSKTMFLAPITIMDPRTRTNAFGVLEVTTYVAK